MSTNESVADGASSQNINEKGASEAPKNERSFKVKVWMVLLAGVALFLVVSAVGGYAFNWTWTGFQGNRLWEWLELLLLPIGLAAAQIWFSSSRSKEGNTKMSKQELPDMLPSLAAHLANQNTSASPQPSSPTGLPDSS